jgi:(1->4)-alpha-D-glucan 1-alpha-D-glucosylmutase
LRARLKPGACLVVEKILLAGETLPADWGCDGTTGYDFMDEVSALQHDPAGERVLAEAWSALSGRPADFAVEEEPARREILARSFGAQLDACAAASPGASWRRPCCAACWASCWRISRSIELFPRGGALSACRPRRARPRHRRRASHLPRDRPLGDRSAAAPLSPSPDHRSAVARFQQLSAPIAAKAVEDTGFYRYGRLLSRNDVGFDPATFALDADAFHRRMQRRRADWPRALLATATHDHKRGEDVRARLAVLSSMAPQWAALQRDWVEASRPLMRNGAPAPWRRRPAAAGRSSAPGPSISTPATAPAAAPSPSGWSPGSRRRCARPSSPATGPAIDEAYEAAARDLHPGAGGRCGRCPISCSGSPPWCSASPRPAR